MLLARLCKAIISAAPGHRPCLNCGKTGAAGTMDSCRECPPYEYIDKDLLHAVITEVMKEHRLEVIREADGPEFFDPTFGDEKVCKCGHTYYRHFDTYDAMRPVGCKYCHMTDECTGFELA